LGWGNVSNDSLQSGLIKAQEKERRRGWATRRFLTRARKKGRSNDARNAGSVTSQS